MAIRTALLLTLALALSNGSLLKDFKDEMIKLKLEELIDAQKDEASAKLAQDKSAQGFAHDPLYVHGKKKPTRILEPAPTKLVCRDTSSLCDITNYISYACQHQFITENCKKSCDLCPSNSAKKREVSSDLTDANFVSHYEHFCQDVQKDTVCRYYASFHGYCTKQENFMRKYCRRTCNFCDDTSELPVCKDSKRLCAVFTSHKAFCKRHRDFFAVQCPRACELCDLKLWLPYPELPPSAIKKLMWQVGKWEECDGQLQWRSVRCIHFDKFLEIPVDPSHCKKVFGAPASPVRNCATES